MPIDSGPQEKTLKGGMFDTMKKLKQKVVLIRHGETMWAREGRHTSFTTCR